MPIRTAASRFAALLAVLTLAYPVVAGEGHDHTVDAATEAHEDDHDHAHDDDHGHEENADDAAHSFDVDGVKVVHPWMNATNGRDALIFLELENSSDASVSLEGAEVPFAETAMLVGFALKDGEGAYQPLPSVPVQPGRSLDLQPEGLAILASGLNRRFTEGDTAKMSLVTSAGTIALTVAVESADARQHSHAGHNH